MTEDLIKGLFLRKFIYKTRVSESQSLSETLNHRRSSTIQQRTRTFDVGSNRMIVLLN